MYIFLEFVVNFLVIVLLIIFVNFFQRRSYGLAKRQFIVDEVQSRVDLTAEKLLVSQIKTKVVLFYYVL